MPCRNDYDDCAQNRAMANSTTKAERLEILKPIPGETVYSEWDEDYNVFGVFGTDSGFCYSTWADENQAEEKENEMNAK